MTLHWHRLRVGLRPLLRFALLSVIILALSRVGLAWHYSDRLAAAGGFADLAWRAWRFDVVVISAVCLPVLLALWLAPARWLCSRTWVVLSTAWLTLWLMFILWNEAATPDFLGEFGVRPNRLYVEYLGTPTEIALTIWQAHRKTLLLGIALTLTSGWLGWQWLHPGPRRPRPASWPVRVLAFAPLVVAAFFGLRGSTGHRPLGISEAAFSTDPLVNTLALNSTYSAIHALVQMERERRLLEAYGSMPRDAVIARVRDGMQLPAFEFTDPLRPSEHRLVPTAHPAGKPNLVILVQESLGARYFPSLGGLPVAQKLESWRTRSFWFDQLYASGTRSARGLEAVVTGFLPTRTSSIIKLEGAQHDFFTIAQLLKSQGYRTEFIYGGDSSFDNMRRFFLGNGFDRVIDWSDLAGQARFKTTWGVSDEDLYARVHEELSAHEQQGQPFFTLVFSTSNHPPFDFPDGRITLFEQPKMTPNNAARYADFAVGSYLERAAQADYWRNTLFLVVADHEARTEGPELVPVFSFHIPGFITGGPVPPHICARLASQTDLLPTTLSLMGLAVELPTTGIDESREDLVGPGAIMMQFHDTAAYRRGDDVVVLQPGQAPREFRVRNQTLVAADTNPGLVRTAMAEALWPVLAYRQHWYY